MAIQTVDLVKRDFTDGASIGENAKPLMGVLNEKINGFVTKLTSEEILTRENKFFDGHEVSSFLYALPVKRAEGRDDAEDQKFGFIIAAYDDNFSAKKANLFFVDTNGEERGVSINWSDASIADDFLANIKHSLQNDGQWPETCPNDKHDNNGGNIRIEAHRPTVQDTAQIYTVGTAPA